MYPRYQLESAKDELSATQSEMRERQDSYQRNIAVLTSKLREVATAREEARRALEAQQETSNDDERGKMERQIQVRKFAHRPFGAAAQKVFIMALIGNSI